MRAIRIFLAGLWLVIGLGVLFWHFATENPKQLTLLDNVYLAIFAIILGLYNFARWWALDGSNQERELQQRIEESRLRRRRRTSPEPDYDNPNPDFDFTRDDPEPPRDESPTSGESTPPQ